MIDSVVLRIHDLKVHADLYQWLCTLKESILRWDGEIVQPDEFMLFLREYRYNDTMKRNLFVNGRVLTSSHYYLAFTIPENRDYIEFNFSVPKLCYGTNLLQFIPHQFETETFFDYDKANSIEWNAEQAYGRLISFIKAYLKRMFPVPKIDYRLVEINRIDVCFMQYFQSKGDALATIEHQKQIKKKHLRNMHDNAADWNTSVWLKSDMYTAKIYHKGSEYKCKKGELKHHKKMNRKFNREIFQIEDKLDKEGSVVSRGLQSYADCAIRYEMTFRASYLSRVFNHRIFRSESAEHKAFVKKGKAFISKEKKWLKAVRVNAGYEKRTGQRDFELLREIDKHRLSESDKVHKKAYVSMRSRTCRFMIETGPVTKEYNRYHRDPVPSKDRFEWHDKALFSKELLKLLIKKFIEFKDQFDIKEKMSISSFQTNVVRYNERVAMFNKYDRTDFEKPKHKVRVSKVNQIIALLQLYSFDQIIEKQMFSRTTMWRYKKQLDEMGFEKNQVAKIEIKSARDFSDYHEIVNSQRFVLPRQKTVIFH